MGREDQIRTSTELHRVSGEFVDPSQERAFLSEMMTTHLALYGQIALLIAVGLSSYAVLDLVSLGLTATFGCLLIARLGASGVVLWTRRRMLRHPDEFAEGAGFARIAATQVTVYAVGLLACALRPADAATHAVSIAVLVLGAMVVVPGRFRTRVTIAAGMLISFTVLAVVRFDDPPLPLLPLVANLAVVLAWGVAVLRITNRDARRRWIAVAAAERATDELERELAVADELRDELQELARCDPLTGAGNRRELLRVTQQRLDDRRRGDLALILLDVDRFKSINDRFGHATGDAALVALADAVRGAVRQGDLVARIGGEEFAVLLPDLDESAALETADRVRAAVAAAPVAGHPELTMTVSVGVTTAADGDTVEAMLARSDDAMYRAKRAGGDGVASGGTRRPEPSRTLG